MGILAEKGHFLCYKGLRLGLIDRMQQMIVGATFALIVLYLIAGGMSGRLMVGLVMEMVIISVFCQGFAHLYLSYSVKSGSFTGLAGFDSKVEYRVEEVKKVLIQMDMHICAVSFGVVLLLGVCAFLGEREAEIVSICAMLSYVLDYTLAICLYNYRGIERTMVRKKDQEMAKAGHVTGMGNLIYS